MAYCARPIHQLSVPRFWGKLILDQVLHNLRYQLSPLSNQHKAKPQFKPTFLASMGLAGPQPVPTGRAHLAAWQRASHLCGSLKKLKLVLAKFVSRADGTQSTGFKFVVAVPELNIALFPQIRARLTVQTLSNSSAIILG